jgi:hypothetical protein
MLPCDKAVCHRCVDFLAALDKKLIKCQNCAKIHEIQIDVGFPKNLALQKLLEFEAKEISHSNQKEELKKLLVLLNATKQSIEWTLDCGDATIHKHCAKVRNYMQLAIAQAHGKLDELCKDFMHEIVNYEKECHEKFKLIQQRKVEDIEKALIESNELFSKSNRLLKQFKIVQSELSTLSDKTHCRCLTSSLKMFFFNILVN